MPRPFQPLRQAQNIVRADLIQQAKRPQMPHGQLVYALFIPGIHLLRSPQRRRHLRLGQVAVLSQRPQNFRIVSHSVVSPPPCKDRRGLIRAGQLIRKKPRRVRVRRREKLGSFFTATCAWGKIPLRLQVWNFCAQSKNYARSRLQAFWQKNQRFFARCLNTPRPSKCPWCIPCRTQGICRWCRTA